MSGGTDIDVSVHLSADGYVVMQVGQKYKLVLNVEEAQRLAGILAETARKSPQCPIPS